MIERSKPGLDTLLYLNKLLRLYRGSLFFTSSGQKTAKVATGATPIENFGGLKRRSGRGREKEETLLVGLRESSVESWPEAKVSVGLRRKRRQFIAVCGETR